MGVEDKQLARDLQREMNRRQSLDISEMRIVVTRGIGYLTGKIRPAPGVFFDPKDETKAIMDTCRRVPGLRDLVIEAEFIIASKK